MWKDIAAMVLTLIPGPPAMAQRVDCQSMAAELTQWRGDLEATMTLIDARGIVEIANFPVLQRSACPLQDASEKSGGNLFGFGWSRQQGDTKDAYTAGISRRLTIPMEGRAPRVVIETGSPGAMHSFLAACDRDAWFGNTDTGETFAAVLVRRLPRRGRPTAPRSKNG